MSNYINVAAREKRGFFSGLFGCLIKGVAAFFLMLLFIVLMKAMGVNRAEKEELAKEAIPASKVEKPPSPSSPGLFEEGIVFVPGSRGAWLALRDEDWDALIDAENFGAQGGEGSTGPIARLARAGRVIYCLNGTRVKVSKGGFTSRRVEILGGEFAGYSGWIQEKLLRKANIESLQGVTMDPGEPRHQNDEPKKEELPKAAPKTPHPDERAATLLRSADSLNSLGNRAKALEYYRKILADYPDTQPSIDALSRIKAMGENP